MTPLKLGTRGSALALWQAERVADEIRAHSGRDCTLVIITTTGDRLTEVSLSTVGGKNVFVKEIEQALLAGDIDLAVHSAKDMPAELPGGLAIPAVLPRADPRDAVVLPAGAAPLPAVPTADLSLQFGASPRVGSGSVRRVAQLRRVWPTAQFGLIRGNVGTRLRKLDAGDYDLLILAAAGLTRLGYQDRISATVDVDTCVPAPGQGIVAIETRSDDQETIDLLVTMTDAAAAAALTAERAVVARLGGGCQVPIGAFAECQGQAVRLRAVVTSLDGSLVLRREATGTMADPHGLGVRVAEGLLEDGAEPLLDAARSDATTDRAMP
ncbi:MAG: hydroxymethylbilane synthase [Acidobacteria bacterium]|nr:hydroxymethylbilane synthase [Acidobacteriota bacterium]